jgi:small-conductance mechanosensitive channel
MEHPVTGRCLVLLALLVLGGCRPPAGTETLPPLPLGTAPPPGKASVRTSPEGWIVVQLNGPTVREAVSELAVAANVAVKVDEQVGAAHRLYLTFQARNAEEALRKLSELGELSLEREPFGAASIYRIGNPRKLFDLDLWHLVTGLALLAFALITDRVLSVFVRRRERSSRKLANRLRQIVSPVRVAVWLFAGVSALLLLLRVPASTAVALAGGGLLLIGFASKDFAANILAGLAIAIDRPLHEGDYVSVAGYDGEVTRIGLRSTQLVTLDDTMITVPNAEIATKAVASANYGDIDALILVTFHVAHQADIASVRALVWEGVVTSAYCSWRRPVHVLVHEETWSTKVVAHAYVFDVRHQLQFVSDVTHRVKLAFAAEGIPYPSRAPLAVPALDA